MIKSKLKYFVGNKKKSPVLLLFLCVSVYCICRLLKYFFFLSRGSDFEDDNNEDSRSVRNDDSKKYVGLLF